MIILFINICRYVILAADSTPKRPVNGSATLEQKPKTPRKPDNKTKADSDSQPKVILPMLILILRSQFDLIDCGVSTTSFYAMPNSLHSMYGHSSCCWIEA